MIISKKSVATIFIMLVTGENKLYINIICSIFNCFRWLFFKIHSCSSGRRSRLTGTLRVLPRLPNSVVSQNECVLMSGCSSDGSL